MKHYWINIDSNEKRQNFMCGQFEKMNLEHHRVSAFTPSNFDEMLAHERPLTCKYPGCNTCEYEFACICSHIKAMQEGLKTGDDYFVILEDDIVLPFVIDYDALVKDMPDDTEILQMLILYGPTVLQFFHIFKATTHLYFKWQNILPSTGMYLISRKGAEKLVELFYEEDTKKYNFSQSPHQIVADVLLYATATTYATTVPYAYPNSLMGSEIHPCHLTAQANAIADIKSVIKQYDTFKFPFVIEKMTM